MCRRQLNSSTLTDLEEANKVWSRSSTRLSLPAASSRAVDCRLQGITPHVCQHGVPWIDG